MLAQLASDFFCFCLPVLFKSFSDRERDISRRRTKRTEITRGITRINGGKGLIGIYGGVVKKMLQAYMCAY